MNTKGFQPLHKLSMRLNVKGVLEIHKATINPLIMDFALLDKGPEGQYMGVSHVGGKVEAAPGYHIVTFAYSCDG